MANKRIGRYEIEKELGAGAMAVVYKAVDPLIGRVVAVKTIKLESGFGMGQAELRDRLFREAQSAGNLSHPAIVTIYDIGEEGPLAYIAMEFVEGESLQEWMMRNPIPPLEQTASIIAQVASGLDYAVSHGVIHRDIKPANILLTSDLRAKIADFGIAKFAASNLTQTGTIMGTPSYMSPEQAMGKTLDGRSDLFSLGVILYEMLTGEKPFAGSNPATIMYKILHEEPVPPQRLNVTLHPAFNIIIARMLAKDPDQRYQTFGEFLHDLKNYKTVGMKERKEAPRDAAPKPRRGFGMTVLALVLMGAIGAGGYYFYTTQIAPPPAAGEDAKGAPAITPLRPPATTAQKDTANTKDAAITKGAEPAAKEVVPKEGISNVKDAGLPAKDVSGTKAPDAAKAAAEKTVPPPAKAPVIPEKPAFAEVRVQFAGMGYPFTVYDGARILPDISASSLSKQVAAGEHRFRIVSEEIYLDQRLTAVKLKADEVHLLTLPGLGSAYVDVPNDAYEGCEITLNGRKLATPYPAQIARLAAGDHRINFKWNSGKYAGKELNEVISILADHLFRVRGEPQTNQVSVQQIR
jgi:predicted Ser/Thr protein kinase